ncbi:unnamed protein product [Spirodela intermedia]|uniref:1-deoxy-D-xylulose-5-phosphate synthase n=1 Tax=Spirodela intermedia TaxID=51605 RepID=A0A7I8JSF2_SPIIN|nr:unnamed protein product [Spirodela intermedia]CAA6672691.1 unnamed protein product [Spirodela intermedia]
MGALPEDSEFFWEKEPTPVLDTLETPAQLKKFSSKELKLLAEEIRSEILYIASRAGRPFKASVGVVELTLAIHYVFNAPVDRILWDVGEQTYAHKILTGRRSLIHSLKQKNDTSVFTSRLESEYDAFGAGHGSNSVSAGLGMAVARDLKGKKERIVTVISNWSTMAGQVYEGMSNAGYLDSNMVVILNDSRHSLHPNPDEGQKMTVSSLSSILSKIQSSKYFRRFREVAKGLTKRIGKGMYELAAKIDEYARGMLGPSGATLFEELGLYYIGPVDGNNIEDLICVLNEVASLDSTGPVLVHVITEEAIGNASGIDVEGQAVKQQVVHKTPGYISESSTAGLSRTYNDCFRFFDVGMAEQHAVTFAAGLSCGGFKPFCIIPSTFLQRAYDQVIQDVDLQRIPVRFAITDAGLVGSDGPVRCGAFDIAFMACLPNMIVMAPSDEDELVRMVATAAQINDRPVCFRFPRGAITLNTPLYSGVPLEIGKGRVLADGEDVALLGYGVMVQHCLKARALLAHLGVQVTVADARFCKPLDIELLRRLCVDHKFLITVEEGTVGGFGSHVAQFMALDGLLDGGIKWRPIVLPDSYIEGASPKEQLEMAGLTGHHIAATILNILGRARDALLLMR